MFFFLPFDNGFDTLAAYFAYEQCYVASVSPQQRQGKVLVIYNQALYNKTVWFHNHHLKFSAGIQHLESPNHLCDQLADTNLVFCSGEVFDSLNDTHLEQLYQFNNSQGSRALKLTDLDGKGLEFEFTK